jgi:transposase
MSVPESDLPAPAPIRISAGIDWAKDDHAVCVVGPEGEVLERFTVRHDAAGLRSMIRRLLKAGVEDVGIERPDGPVVEALLQTELPVFVLPPSQVKNLRSRYGSAGNKDDRFDAYVLGDAVRTDRRRLRPLQRDSAQTTALRSLVRARRDLVHHWVGLANQLRAHLQIVFPAATVLFDKIDSQVSLTFLERFTTQTQTDRHIFTSLPRSGTVRAARLLAEIGDARGRFPTPESLTCLAGLAPSTRQSGKVKAVTFRWAVDKQLRDAVTDFAGDSRHAKPWAANLYQKAIARGCDHPHAVRILARAWLHIIGRCWQDGLDYDPTRHRALQTLHNQDQHRAA